MKKDKSKPPTLLAQKADSKSKDTSFPGYPSYPASEDIYSNDKEERELDPENPKEANVPREKYGKRNEKEFKEDMSGRDLDVPGSELDDGQEDLGSEDEENNYYSLGGDDHEGLDEDNG